MYPPRDRSAEVYQPPSELKSAIFRGCLFLGIAVVVSLANHSANSGAWMFVLAGIEGLEAMLIRAEVGRTARWACRTACVAATFAFWWWMGRSVGS